MPKPSEFVVYPGVGVARLGPSAPISAFLGPELPDPDFSPPGLLAGKYRTPLGNIRRQLARFRVYRVKWRRYKRGWVPRSAEEITDADGFTLKWKVTVANRKAFTAYDTFDATQGIPPLSINDRIENAASAEVSGVSQSLKNLKGNARDLLLAQIRTDDQGRLLFLAGEGECRDVGGAGLQPPPQLFHKGWFDDACDGSVECEVVDPAGQSTQAERAWVVTGPPAFAHQIGHSVTLYDVAETIAVGTKRWPRASTSVVHHIQPMLRTTERQRWVSTSAFSGHHLDYTPFDAEELLRKPGTAGALPAADHRQKRREIMVRLKHPSVPRSAGRKRPWLPHWYPPPGDSKENDIREAFRAISNGPHGEDMPLQAGLPFTLEQWLHFKRWRNAGAGSPVWDYPAAAVGVPPRLEDIHPVVEQLDALNRAHLGSMVGGSTAPGIEVGWRALEPSSWGLAFRPSATLQPGELTYSLSIPWPVDFFACTTFTVTTTSGGSVSNVWWPAARPLEVNGGAKDWDDTAAGSNVDWWKSRGFVAKAGGGGFKQTEPPA